MSITYPLALPSQNFARFELSSDDRIGLTRSPFSMATQKIDWGGNAWRARVELPPMTETTARAWIATLAALRGHWGTFLMGDPFSSTQLGSLSTADAGQGIRINEDAPSGYTLATRGWTPSATGVLKAGDFFQVGYGEFARLYMVTQDVDADGSGNATVCIWPKWRKDISAETPAEVLTDGGFENWTAGSLDSWTKAGNANLIEASTTPAPQAGSKYVELEQTDSNFSEVKQSALTLVSGMPYRFTSYYGADAASGNNKVLMYIQNQTQLKRLLTKLYSTDSLAANGDIWVDTTSSSASSRFDAAVADTWYLGQFGVWVPTAYPSTDTYQVRFGTTEDSGHSTYYDAASLYGPSFDGTQLNFTNPKGIFKLDSNVRGYTIQDLVTYGLAFEAIEDLSL